MNEITASRPLVLITTSYPIGGDGSEAAGSFVGDLVAELAESCPVRIVAPGKQSALETPASRIEVYRFAAPERPLSLLKPWVPRDLCWIARVLRGGLAMTRAATRESAGILALWGLPCGEWARRVARERHMSYSVWMLGSDVWTLGRVPLLRGRLARVIREAAHAYADGLKLADDAGTISGSKVEFLPSTRAIDVEAPPVRASPPYRLLFLGRWHPNKGIDLLLDALALLEDAHWRNIERVCICGGGPLERDVQEKAARLREMHRPVSVGGYLDKPAAVRAILEADYLVLPSRIESIPVVFSDAMKLRRPVIATPVGDLPALFAKAEYGVLAAGVSAAAIADSIRAATGTSPGGFAVALREHAARFDLGTIARRIVRETVHG
jgi:glycosyltransferase involved in cell wall biosynthesis